MPDKETKNKWSHPSAKGLAPSVKAWLNDAVIPIVCHGKSAGKLLFLLPSRHFTPVPSHGEYFDSAKYQTALTRFAVSVGSPVLDGIAAQPCQACCACCFEPFAAIIRPDEATAFPLLSSFKTPLLICRILI